MADSLTAYIKEAFEEERRQSGPKTQFLVLQGSELVSRSDLEAHAKAAVAREKRPEHAWPIGRLMLPHKLLYTHVLYVGMTGSGKTTFINQFKRNTLPKVGRGFKHRACIWDYKSEELQHLKALGLWHEGDEDDPNRLVHYINPADKRGVGIDVARDVSTELEADQFARDVIAPEAKEGGENAVWVEAARSCVSQVVKTFQEKARDARGNPTWRLIDVIEACFYSHRLRQILRMTPEGRAIEKDTLGPNDQAQGVFFTIQSFAKNLRPIAASMARLKGEGRLVSLRNWVKGRESIIVIGNNPVLKENLAPLQRWIFGYLSRTLLAQEQSDEARYLFFLDEVRQAPFGNQLSELATNGRSKGASLIVGLQDTEGFKDSLGQFNAEEFVGMFGTLVFLRIASVKTAEWASNYFGTHLRMTKEVSESKSDSESRGPQGTTNTDGRTENFAYKPMERKLVYPNEFRAIKRPRDEGRGLEAEAIVSIADVGDGRIYVAGLQKAVIYPDPNVPTLVPCGNEDFQSKWEKEDLVRLRLPAETHSEILDEAPKPASPTSGRKPKAGSSRSMDEDLERAEANGGESEGADSEFRQIAEGLIIRVKGAW